MGKTRILYVSHVTEMSGAEFCLLHTMAGLERERYRLFLVCPREGPLVEEARSLGVQVAFLPILPRMEFLRNPFVGCFSLVRSWIGLANLIRREGIQIMHANALMPSIYAGLVAKALGIPAILHLRDTYRGSRFKVRLQLFLSRVVSHRIIAASQAASEPFGADRKMVVIHDGVDTSIFSPDRDTRSLKEEFAISHETVVGMVAKLVPQKGVGVFIEAAAQVATRICEVKYLIVGDVIFEEEKKYKRAFQKRVRELALEDKVIFTGFRREMPQFYSLFDIFVHPPIYPDALPGVVYEAMACGRPVIASRIGGIPEIVSHGETGVLVEPGNPTALAAAIISLLEGEGKRTQLGQKAREAAKVRFSMERYVGEIEGLYRELLEEEQRS